MAACFSAVSAATTNLTSVTPKSSILTGWYIMNTSAATRYVRLYNKGTAPVPASDTPVLRIPLPAGDGTNLSLSTGPIYFGNGLAFDITAGAADTDTTVVAAGDVTINLFFE